MKILIKLAYLATIIIMITSCKKSELPDPKIASGVINVTNAIVGSSTLTFTTSNSLISSNNTLGSNAYARFPLASGQVTINLGVPAIAATPKSAAVPTVPYYSSTLTVENASNYSLFLTGTSPSSIDNVLIKENYTSTYADSVCGIRFINLAPGSGPISVNIQGTANGSEIASLAYKAYSGFNKHAATSAISSYIFEFRDVGSGDLLATYTVNTPYSHNVTLCLSGSAGNYGVIEDYDY